MTRDELERAIKLGRKPLCVDASRVETFPSRVREVTILKSLEVMIEFNTYGHDEGGPTYIGRCPDLETLVEKLERFFGRPLSKWENHNASGRYPEPPDGWTGIPDPDEGERFVTVVAARQLRLPEGDFEQQSAFWAEVEAKGSQA